MIYTKNAVQKYQNFLQQIHYQVQIEDSIHYITKNSFYLQIWGSYLENFKKDKDTLFNFYENDLIPKTNNTVEGYYKHTMEKYYKNTFQTSEGIDTFLELSEIRWYEDVVFQQEIEIQTNDIWHNVITSYSNP